MMKQKQEKEYVNDDEKQMLCFATDKTNCFSDQFNKKNPSTQSNVIYEIQILKMKFYYIKIFCIWNFEFWQFNWLAHVIHGPVVFINSIALHLWVSAD